MIESENNNILIDKTQEQLKKMQILHLTFCVHTSFKIVPQEPSTVTRNKNKPILFKLKLRGNRNPNSFKIAVK